MQLLAAIALAAAVTLAPDGPPPRVLEEDITFDCRSCGAEQPQTIWDEPTCDELDLDEALIEAMHRGDRSAVALLQRRHETAFTVQQRIDLAAALLGQVADDRDYWKELFALAQIAVRGQFASEPHETLAFRALSNISNDRRARPLLLDGLRSENLDVILASTSGLSLHRDARDLQAIRDALEGRPGMEWVIEDAVRLFALEPSW
ncbi:MAG TPA: hypothetical protein VEK11_03785 [Thermoanaerobaculia bacterium]|nr:hypothetical protein [Thermoanaerobaculia bacterium]